jgi:hypothetical protein
VDNKGAYGVVHCIKGGSPARVNSFLALS